MKKIIKISILFALILICYLNVNNKVYAVKLTSSNTKITCNSSYTYTGKAIKPEFRVEFSYNKSKKTLKRNTDYSVTYGINIRPSSCGSLTIKGKGVYTGSVKKTFKINKKNIEDFEKKVQVGETSSYSWYKGELEPEVSIPGLSEKTDFSVEYRNNTNVGTATVKINGKGNYTGSIKKYFQIKAVDIKLCNFTFLDNKKSSKPKDYYDLVNDKSIKPEISIDYSIPEKYNYYPSKKIRIIKRPAVYKLQKDKDYTVKYSEIKWSGTIKNNIMKGKKTITIKGIGNFKGSKTYEITIRKIV